jgi:hypothetical protein
MKSVDVDQWLDFQHTQGQANAMAILLIEGASGNCFAVNSRMTELAVLRKPEPSYPNRTLLNYTFPENDFDGL